MSSFRNRTALYDADHVRHLGEGRTLGVPLAWFPRLLRLPRRSSAISAGLVVAGKGLHWEELDEDISVEGLLAGRSDMTRRKPEAA